MKVQGRDREKRQRNLKADAGLQPWKYIVITRGIFKNPSARDRLIKSESLEMGPTHGYF